MALPPYRFRHALQHALAAAVIALSAASCAGGERRAGDAPPSASFLVVAGDSTFWIESAGDGVRVRRSPLFLTQVAGNFHELYVADVDQSYYDALIVGQRLYRRDLISGDSLLLVEDTALAAIASDYAAKHPDERPLATDDEGALDPTIQATTETELVEVLGPYLTYEVRRDIDIVGTRDEHLTMRGVVDVRDGRAVAVSDLAGTAGGRRIEAEARRLLVVAIDSIGRATGERARRAQSTITGLEFNPHSFTLLDGGGVPAVAYFVPGRGAQAGGYALPLAPLRLPAGAWWREVRETLPSAGGRGASWTAPGYDVVAHEDSSGEWAALALRTTAREWRIARLPLPVRRLHRLDGVPNDSPVRQALARAFDESALYSGEGRTALAPRHPPRVVLAARPGGAGRAAGRREPIRRASWLTRTPGAGEAGWRGGGARGVRGGSGRTRPPRGPA